MCFKKHDSIINKYNIKLFMQLQKKDFMNNPNYIDKLFCNYSNTGKKKNLKSTGKMCY